MSTNAEPNLFPSTVAEALAFLYVQSQNLTGKKPSEIHTMYQEAYFEILKDKKEKLHSGWFKSQKEEF